MNRDINTDPRGMEWKDFFPQWKEKPKEQTEEEMFNVMMQFTKSREGLPA